MAADRSARFVTQSPYSTTKSLAAVGRPATHSVHQVGAVTTSTSCPTRGSAVSRFLADAERGRYDGPAHITPELAARNALRPYLTADIRYATTTYDVFRSLIEDRG